MCFYCHGHFLCYFSRFVFHNNKKRKLRRLNMLASPFSSPFSSSWKIMTENRWKITCCVVVGACRKLAVCELESLYLLRRAWIFFQGDYYNLVIFILSWFLRITVSKLLLMEWSENQHFYSHLSTSDIHVYLVTLMATYSPVQQAVENRIFRAAWKFKCLRSLFLSGWRKFSKAKTWKMCFSTIVVHAAVRAMLTTQKKFHSPPKAKRGSWHFSVRKASLGCALRYTYFESQFNQRLLHKNFNDKGNNEAIKRQLMENP